MAKTKAKANKATGPAPTFSGKRGRRRPFLAALCLIASIMMLISLIDYNEHQNWRFHEPVQEINLGGEVGVNLAYYSLNALGWIAYSLPVFLLWLAYMLFFRHGHRLRTGRIAALVLSIVSLCVLLTLAEQQWMLEPDGEEHGFTSNTLPYGTGGFTGHTLYRSYLEASIGMGGTIVVFSILLLFSIGYLTYDNVLRILQRIPPMVQPWWERRREKARQRREARATRKAEKVRRRAEDRAARKAEKDARKTDKDDDQEEADISRTVIPRRKPAEPPLDASAGDRDSGSSGAMIEEPEPPPPPEEAPKQQTNGANARRSSRKHPEEANGGNLKIIKGEPVRKAARPVPNKKGNYAFPPLDLLHEPDPEPETQSPANHKRTAEILVRTLGEFGVKVTMGEVHTGPVITRYDVYPAAGVRVEKIVNLDKNLALALKALSVRILAPVPGKGCVGIEVPNEKPQSVYIRDILESEDWVNHKGEIPIALGKEVSGKPLVTDLTRMPHLLIAGSTGAGKTVCINSVVTSLLYHSSPEDLRFVMVDPKIVELQAYNSLPHMLIPVVTDPKKVPGALKYLLNEMERRYHMFASVGARNVAGYNAKMARKSDAEADEHARELDRDLSPEERAAVSAIEVPRDRELDLPEKLPYIVVIVDELADLMMVAPADIETGIARLAQLARAAGIHLIIATQRPSVNVITGVIKANLPSRISFKVAAKVDSRTILDTMGADHLIGRGDLLFLPPGSSDLIRAQGAFISDDEITAIIDYLKQNGEPEFDEEFQRSVEEGVSEDGNGDGERSEEDDEMLAPALDVLRTTKRASTSMIQRKLKIGYNRAARIMETLEDRGIVGPDNGSQPREILRDLDSL